MSSHAFSNDGIFGEGEFVFYLKQDLNTAMSKTGAQQTRVSGTTYRKIDALSIQWDPDTNVKSHNRPFIRTAKHTLGAISLQGTVEVETDITMWEGISKGCEILIKENGDYIWIPIDINKQGMTDPTATSITLKNGTVINDSKIIPPAKGGGWDPADVVTGKILVPRSQPVFTMKIVARPFTGGQKEYFLNGVTFGQVTKNTSRPGFSIRFFAEDEDIEAYTTIPQEADLAT